MAATTEIPKVTYTTMSMAQAEAFNLVFDDALKQVRSSFGQVHPIVIGGRELESGKTVEDPTPNDVRIVLGEFQQATFEHAAAAIAVAREAFAVWSRMPY